MYVKTNIYVLCICICVYWHWHTLSPTTHFCGNLMWDNYNLDADKERNSPRTHLIPRELMGHRWLPAHFFPIHGLWMPQLWSPISWPGDLWPSDEVLDGATLRTCSAPSAGTQDVGWGFPVAAWVPRFDGDATISTLSAPITVFFLFKKSLCPSSPAHQRRHFSN